MPEEDMTTDTICFHCQQAVEKLLKSFLVHCDVDFRKEHNLEYLLALCMRADTGFAALEFGRMSEYGVVVRYPAEFYMPSVEETDEAIRIARSVDTYVRGKLAAAGYESG